MRYPLFLLLGMAALGLFLTALGLGTMISALYELVRGNWTWLLDRS